MLTEFFDCVLVINLESRTDRRSEMESELNKIGLSFTNGSAEILTASRFAEPAGFETIGARGCYDSHLRALKAAFERNAKNVLIFEDDCDFAIEIDKQLPDILRQLANTNWSIFYGGYLSQIQEFTGLSGIGKIDPARSLSGAHFIGFAGAALPKLIPYLETMRSREPGSPLGGPMHVDGAYSWFRKDHPELETWVARSQLGTQRPSRTDIHKLKFYDRWLGLRQIVGTIRRLKRKIGP